MGLLNNKNKWRVLVFLVAFVSFITMLTANAARSAVIANYTHATHLIQGYLITHPVEIEIIKQTQEGRIKTLNQLQQLSQRKLAKQVAANLPRVARLPSIFPVRSSLLHPGKVITRSIQETLPQPIFIVGNDMFSKQWLMCYQKRLSMLNAKGFVVNVKDDSALQALQTQFSNLSLMPMPGDQLAQWLKLKHYPVLISNHLMEQ